jgi:regulatory LuxR family protein
LRYYAEVARVTGITNDFPQDFPLLILNKQIAAQIGTAENTVKVHRSRAMEKMQANSLADLIKMIERLQVPRGNSP